LAKYDVTYSCGHTDIIQLYGSTKDREWRLACEEEKLCPDCWKAKLEADRQKKNEEAAEVNKATGLPPLEGSEKQVPWAETIRRDILDIPNRKTDIWDRPWEDWCEKFKLPPEDAGKGLDLIKKHTSASWWIDHRGLNKMDLIQLIKEELKAFEKELSQPPKAVIEEAKAEATIYPEKPVSDLVAEIKNKTNTIEVFYPERNETFRQLVRSLGFRWNQGWSRKVGHLDGSVEDRVAETGNKLLAAGFPVRIYDAELRRKAIAGEYEEEPKRWILARVEGEYEGWLAISWSREGNNYYNAARKIAGSKYSRPSVVVPPENFMEVLDFAKMYKFNISEKAQTIIDTARELKEKALVTGVKVPESVKPPKPGDKPPVLEVPEKVGVADELRDDD
jgi:hypothetical protein